MRRGERAAGQGPGGAAAVTDPIYEITPDGCPLEPTQKVPRWVHDALKPRQLITEHERRLLSDNEIADRFADLERTVEANEAYRMALNSGSHEDYEFALSIMRDILEGRREADRDGGTRLQGPGAS